MIPVHKLYKKYSLGTASTESYVFMFPAAYDTIQVMWKFSGSTTNADKLHFAALEIAPTSTEAVAVDPIQFVPTGTPIAGDSTQQIILFDWKAPALRISFERAHADVAVCEVFVKTFSYGLADANSLTQFNEVVRVTSGALTIGKFGFAGGSSIGGGNTLNIGREVPAA